MDADFRTNDERRALLYTTVSMVPPRDGHKLIRRYRVLLLHRRFAAGMRSGSCGMVSPKKKNPNSWTVLPVPSLGCIQQLPEAQGNDIRMNFRIASKGLPAYLLERREGSVEFYVAGQKLGG